MLHLIPVPLHRLGLRLAHALRKQWWRVRRPVVLGCRVLAFDAQGRLLLIRHSYGRDHWTLPGGGIRRGEDPVLAATREFLEETGCILGDPRLFARLDEPLFGATNRVHFITGMALGEPCPDDREVIALAFHACTALPQPLAPSLAAGIDDWLARIAETA
jgi:8-oxo-dGTP pyrophosphatase MutT (NUDIX family)